MNCAVPAVWRDPQCYSSDCYFCITQIKGISSKSKHTVKYPNLPPAMKPVPHSEDLPIPHPATHLTVEDVSGHKAATEVPNEEQAEATFETVHLLTQGELNELVRDLKLSKKQAERLGSRLRGWNLLQEGTKVCFVRNRQEEFQYFYSEKNYLVYCNNNGGVTDVLDREHKTSQCRLFIDCSKTSLKAVLLHSGNKLPSVPLAYVTNMKETYEN
jgi:hypothetical protein